MDRPEYDYYNHDEEEEERRVESLLQFDRTYDPQVLEVDECIVDWKYALDDNTEPRELTPTRYTPCLPRAVVPFAAYSLRDSPVGFSACGGFTDNSVRGVGDALDVRGVAGVHLRSRYRPRLATRWRCCRHQECPTCRRQDRGRC